MSHNLVRELALLKRAETARAEKAEAALEALREIHDYHCGCDQPGRLDLCVAKPTSVFGVLQ